MVVPENTGVYINDFMFDLDLKGFELLAYALIYSYSANGNKQGYYGSCESMAKRLHTTRQRINIVLNSLAEKKLVIKHDIYVNKVKMCVYQTNYKYKKDEGVIETVTGCHRNDDRGVIETMHNNILYNINNNINSKSHYDNEDNSSLMNDSSSVAIAPSSESLQNSEEISEDREPDNTSSSETNTKVSPKDVVSHYSERWNIMRERGYVHTDCPKQSYPLIGKLIKSSGASLDEIKKAIDLGFKTSEQIIKSNGYPLKTMLSSWWINKVLNGSTEPQNKYQNKKYNPVSPDHLENEEYKSGAWK